MDYRIEMLGAVHREHVGLLTWAAWFDGVPMEWLRHA